MNQEALSPTLKRQISSGLLHQLENLSEIYEVSEQVLLNIAIKKFLNLPLNDHCELIAEYLTCEKLGQHFDEMDLRQPLQSSSVKAASRF